MLDMHRVLKKGTAFFQSTAGAKRGTVMWSCGYKKWNWIKEWNNGWFICSSRAAFCKRWKAAGRYRCKVVKKIWKRNKGTHARVSVITLSLCTLPGPLLYFPCRPSLWQKYKGVKSKPAEAHCLRELWWKIQIKWYQFWNMFKDAAGFWMESAKSSKDSTYNISHRYLVTFYDSTT